MNPSSKITQRSSVGHRGSGEAFLTTKLTKAAKEGTKKKLRATRRSPSFGSDPELGSLGELGGD